MRVISNQLGGGYSRPVRRFFLSGLGAAVALNDVQIEEFLKRHPDARAKVNRFLNQVEAGGWDESPNTPARQYAIPMWGFSVPDTEFGNVLIDPDFNGLLHFSGNITPQQAIEVNKRQFISPPGDPKPWWEQMIEWAPWVVGGVLLIGVLNVMPRGR